MAPLGSTPPAVADAGSSWPSRSYSPVGGFRYQLWVNILLPGVFNTGEYIVITIGTWNLENLFRRGNANLESATVSEAKLKVLAEMITDPGHRRPSRPVGRPV